MRFIGSEAQTAVEGVDRLPSRVSYINSNNPDEWRIDVPVWAEIRYVELYPGVDLRLTSVDGEWDWTFAVKDLSRFADSQKGKAEDGIRIRFDGHAAVTIDGDKVLVTTDVGTEVMPIPSVTLVASQGGLADLQVQPPHLSGNDLIVLGVANGTPTPTPAESSTPTSTTTETPTDTPAASPTQTASETITASPTDTPIGAPTDISASTATPSPTSNTAPPTGELSSPTPTPEGVSTPTFGGSLPPARWARFDRGLGALAAPASPSHLAGVSDLKFSTYIGWYVGDRATGVAVDSSGAPVIVGITWGAFFPTTPGSFQPDWQGGGIDCFVTKFSPQGSTLMYSTFLGGSGYEECNGVAMDGAGNAYVVGWSSSPNFPTTPESYQPQFRNSADAIVSVLNPTGNGLVYSTFLGGVTSSEVGNAIAVGLDGAAYVTGRTSSTDFPTTANAPQMTNHGYQDVFVTKLLPDGSDLSYSTYLGGSYNEEGFGIAVDPSGGAYVTGTTPSTDFPRVNAYQGQLAGEYDAFVTKVSPDGSAFDYSTYLGSASSYEEGDAIAVNSSGEAIVTGHTPSTTFPTTPGSVQPSNPGGYSAFVTKFSSSGSQLVFSTYLGGTGGSHGNAIAYGTDGSVYVAGNANEGFPVSADAYDSTYNLYGDVFATRLNPQGSAIVYSTYIGGGGTDIASSIALRPNDAAYIAGRTTSTNFPVVNPYQSSNMGEDDAFVLKLAMGPTAAVVEEASTYSIAPPKYGTSDARAGVLSAACCAQGTSGDPINTKTGGLDYAVSDMTIATSAGALLFERSYSSLTTGLYTGALGYGWTNNHDIRLIFSGDPGGQAGHVFLKATNANQFDFLDNGNQTYSATAGILATLMRNGGPPVTYTVTDPTQGTYTFSEVGKIQSWADAQGHTWTYTYDGNGRLDRVSADSGLRYLQFGYDAQNRISTVTDQTSRGITLGYDANGDLHTVLDVNGKTWTYTYYASHLLRLVQDPEGVTVTHTEYDAQGRAYQQYDPAGTLVLQITYNPDGTATITELGSGVTHAYDSRNTLTGETDALSHSITKTYDDNFRPDLITDKNGNPTQLTWSSTGANLNQLIDATNGQVDLVYDSLNNLRQVTDARRYLTTYSYNEADPDPAKRTLLNSTTDALNKTTSFTYTTTADAPQPVGLLKTITDPLTHTTSFFYNEFGQRISSTDAVGKTTHYSYDTLGRLKTVEDPLGHKTWSCYDGFGRIVRSVANASGDGGTPQTDPCDAANYIPSSDAAFDRISTTVHDDGGRVIATIDPAGVITRTYYDSASRPEFVVQNLVGQGIEVGTPPAYNPAYADRDIRTQTVYDTNANAIASIDTLGIITRTYYDVLNRPEYVVQNLIGQGIEVGTPPLYDPGSPDRNVRTQTYYDNNGNVIATKDNAGHITRTYYDADNRPVTVVQNLSGQDIPVPTPPSRNPAIPDQNLRTDTTYDANGNVIGTTDPVGIITRTYYDADNRPTTVARSLYGQGILVETPPTYNPLYPDRNVLTDTYYDDAGNAIATVDTLGVITRTYYDADNRPEYVVQNLVGQGIYVTAPPTYNPTYPDQNVRTQTVYDDGGRAIASINTLGVITRTYFDALGRAQYVVQNLTGQAISEPTPPTYNPAYPDQNVRTTTTYDALGNAIASTDNAGAITRTYYDDLHRARYVVKNLVGQGIEVTTPPGYNPAYPDQNVRNETIYDGDGGAVRTIDPVGMVTHTCFDGQRRTVKSVDNPSVSDPCGSYTPSANTDEDIITLTTYDAAGNRDTSTDALSKVTHYDYDGVNRLATETDPLTHATSYGYDVVGNRVSLTDAKNVVTSYEFDALGRLTAVVENYKPGFNPDQETNVRTEYTYDGLGNRKTIKDARTYVTNFGYDALSRLTAETDPLSHATTYGYDGVGNRKSLLDANGATTTFSYDSLNRPTGIDYPAPDSDVTLTYDAAGNRQTMVDGMGTTQWVYDDLNRATSISNPVGGTVGYGYDGAGHRTSLTYPDTKQVGYSFDLAGRLHIVTDWDSLQTTYTYDKASRPGTTTIPNGLVSTYGFDDAGRLNTISHVRSSTTLASYAYGVDEVGIRTSVSETIRQPAVAATQLWVSDNGNNRRTLFDIASITNGENAVDLVGQYDSSGSILYTKNGANDGPNVRGLNTPYDSIVDVTNHRLFVSDTSNNRVLLFNLDASNQLVDRVADAVLGQPNMTSRAASLTATGENTPRGLALDPATNRLFVADAGYHRVLVYDVTTVTNGESAVNVLGQTTFTAGSSGLAQNRLNGPRGLALSAGLLFVGDTTNNRVMVFDVTSITNGENAVHVLGQATYTTNTAATTQTGFSSPRGPSVDGSDRLFVADTTNNRVMVFDVSTITDGEAAINVLGQATFTTSTAATSQTGLRAPEDAFADGSNRLFVGDSSNHRVMVFDVATITDGEPAINVLGQASFTAGSSSVSQNRLYTPYGVSVQGSLLYVADANNHRVMVFDVASITNGENAVNLAGQVDGSLSPSYTKNGPNDGPNLQGFNLAGAFAAQVIDFAAHRLFASDPTNNRVLVFDLDANNQLLDRTADAVLGQTGFYSRTAAAAQNKFSSPRGLTLDPASRRLFVADYSNSRVLVFDVTTVANGQNAINVLGQTTFTSASGATAQNRLKNPAGVALDTSRTWLFVGDYNNNRVMVFDVASITNGENAINVLGQTTFTTATAATSQSGLRYPTGVSVDGGTGRLFVADTNNHRVMLFDVTSITNGQNAINVLGQTTFTTATGATTQAGMRSPQGIALDPASNRLFVGDTANHRVTVFDVASVTNGENAVNVLGQANFTSGSAATTQSRMSSPIGILPVATATDVTTTISYTYDPLYRLKNADYNTGPYFHYTYDATGNRLTQTTQAGSNSYVYDNANRLTSVDGVTYTWDNNGNLLSDGASTYTYDHANRLATAVQGSNSYAFGYNGLGNRLRQMVNASPINYSVDINTNLAVVLADGTNTYLYGPAVGSVQGARVGERQTGGWVYPLEDALASTRQLVDPAGGITLAQTYEPFGSTMSVAGSGTTVFQFTGEQRDGSGLVFLRARYYRPAQGVFISHDTWPKDMYSAMPSAAWTYGMGNPVNRVDPSGQLPIVDPCTVFTSERQCKEDVLRKWHDEAQEPPYLTWSPQVVVPPALILDENDKEVPAGTPQSQFYIENESCGVVAIAAILRTTNVTMTANRLYDIASRLPGRQYDPIEDGLGAWSLREIAESQPGWDATIYQDWPGWLFDEGLAVYVSNEVSSWAELLRGALARSTYPIAGVHVNGGTGEIVGVGGSYHWVVVSALSGEWSRGYPWQWVKIHNPFDNQPEYYRWGSFWSGWWNETSVERHEMVVVQPK